MCPVSLAGIHVSLLDGCYSVAVPDAPTDRVVDSDRMKKKSDECGVLK